MVRLDWDGRRVRRASVRSSRPLATPRALAGRRLRDAASMVPLLYSVCAVAQGAAASSAMASADGRTPAAGVLAARSLAVALEALQEDLRRLLIDVPAAAGVPPMVAPVADARKAILPALARLRPLLDPDTPDRPGVQHGDVDALARLLDGIVAREVLGTSVGAFVELGDASAFAAWSLKASSPPARVVRRVLDASPRLGASDVMPMPDGTRPAIESAVLAALDAEPDYARAPHWAGAAVETGALARHRAHPGLASFVAAYGNGVAARLVARLLDVAQTVRDVAAGRDGERLAAWSATPGEGVATVQTARGLLVHRARVAEGSVAGYAIVAPTEWNFHPAGPLVRGLEGMVADDRELLARDANLVVQALDPCVACSVEVGHA